MLDIMEVPEGMQVEAFVWSTGIFQTIEDKDNVRYVNVIDIKTVRNVKYNKEDNTIEANANVYVRLDKGGTEIYDEFKKIERADIKLIDTRGSILKRFKEEKYI